MTSTFLGVLAVLALVTLPLATFLRAALEPTTLGVFPLVALPRFFLTTSDQRVALRADLGT